MAFETMYQYLPDTVNLLENVEYLNVSRKGNSWYNRVNLSWRLSSGIYMNISPGVRIAPFLQMNQPFLRNMGAELALVSISFPDVNETLTGPVFYLFWQWN